MKGICTITEGDHRLLNNIFIGGSNPELRYGTVVFDASKRPIIAEDNLFFNGAAPMTDKNNGPVYETINPKLTVEETPDGKVYINTSVGFKGVTSFKGKKVDAGRLGTAQLSGIPFENPDGSPYSVDKDYFGNSRGASTTVGPIEKFASDRRIKVWPKAK